VLALDKPILYDDGTDLDAVLGQRFFANHSLAIFIERSEEDGIGGYVIIGIEQTTLISRYDQPVALLIVTVVLVLILLVMLIYLVRKKEKRLQADTWMNENREKMWQYMDLHKKTDGDRK